LQPTSVRGVHAPLGQLRRLREMVADGETILRKVQRARKTLAASDSPC
jgi:hypothetical protein